MLKGAIAEGESWVCVDCYFTHHYGNANEQLDENGLTQEGIRPLNKFDASYELADNTDSETGEGIHEFSWNTCHGCGSRLGGSRYRLHWWLMKEEDDQAAHPTADRA